MIEMQIIDQPTQCALSLVAWLPEPSKTLTSHWVCPWTKSTWLWFSTGKCQQVSLPRAFASCFTNSQMCCLNDYSFTFTHILKYFFSPSACSHSELFVLVIIQEPRPINQPFHTPPAAFRIAIGSIHHKQPNGCAAPNLHLLFHLLLVFFMNAGFLQEIMAKQFGTWTRRVLWQCVHCPIHANERNVWWWNDGKVIPISKTVEMSQTILQL